MDDERDVTEWPPASRPATAEPPEVLFDHNSREFASDRVGALRTIADGCPVVHSSAYDGYYLVTGWREVTTVLRNPGVFSSRDSVTIPDYPAPFGAVQLDPPLGPSFRRAINPWFTAATAEAGRERTRKIVADCIDQFVDRGRADFLLDLTGPVASLSTIESLGLPLGVFSRYVDLFRQLNAADPSHDDMTALHAEMTAFLDDVTTEVAQRYDNPVDDLISVLAGIEFSGQRLSREDVRANVHLFFAGGVDTTTQLTAWTLYYLHQNHALRRRLRTEKSLLRPAFDEFLRLISPVQGIARSAVQDSELGGYAIPSGTRVWTALAAANRRPDVFENPDVFDLDRENARHLGFGTGTHKCLGQHVSRVWWEEIVTGVLDRIPDYVVDEDGFEPYPTGQLNGIKRMPVTF